MFITDYEIILGYIFHADRQRQLLRNSNGLMIINRLVESMLRNL